VPRTSLSAEAVRAVTARLSDVEPHAPAGRQPVHTCYVPADRVSPSTPAEWGAQALAALDEHAPDGLADVLDLPSDLAEAVDGRVRAKLAAEPVEDLRIDF
jgi:hypothetical protein